MQDDLVSTFGYDPETGKVFWKTNNHRHKIGDEAGWVTKNGYRLVRYGNKDIYAHRLAWFLTYGEWPSKQIDHINHNKLDNRIENLRDVSASQNLLNKSKITLGITYSYSISRWIAQDGRRSSTKKYIGCFKEREEALKAYKEHMEKYPNV